MRLYYDNEVTIHMAKNLVFYGLTKHIEVDCHLVCQKRILFKLDMFHSVIS